MPEELKEGLHHKAARLSVPEGSPGRVTLLGHDAPLQALGSAPLPLTLVVEFWQASRASKPSNPAVGGGSPQFPF